VRIVYGVSFRQTELESRRADARNTKFEMVRGMGASRRLSMNLTLATAVIDWSSSAATVVCAPNSCR
jgi:hypothetical protein